jgi:AcrR family transcriptional regulator
MAGKKVLRREPRQERGRRRIEGILEAAARVFAEVGYEAATTNAIAREARTSIGSLYQFFPNKGAVLEALAARYERELRAVHDAVLNEETAALPLPAVYDRVVDSLAEFHAAHPGFRPLFYGSTTSPALAAAAARLHGECVGRVEAMLAVGYPGLEPARRRLYATINVEVIKALLPLSESGDAAFRARVLAEIKRLLRLHLEGACGPEPGVKAGRATPRRPADRRP